MRKEQNPSNNLISQRDAAARIRNMLGSEQFMADFFLTASWISFSCLCHDRNQRKQLFLNRGIFLVISCMYYIQHCFICRHSDSIVSEDAGIEPRTVATLALAVRRSSHSATSHPPRLHLTHTRLHLTHTRLHLMHTRVDLIHTRLHLIHTRLHLIYTWLYLSSTLGYFSSTLGYFPSTLGYISSTLGFISSTLGFISFTLGYILSTIGYISSTLGYISCTLGYISSTNYCVPRAWCHLRIEGLDAVSSSDHVSSIHQSAATHVPTNHI